MRTIRLYLPKPYQIGAELHLDNEAFHHAIHVLRAKSGQSFELFDGEGQCAKATLINVSRKLATLKINELKEVKNESPLKTVLIQAVSKGDRMDFSLQKSTELGVHHLQPILTQQSNVHMNQDRWQKRMLHYHQIVRHAAEQCGRVYLPQVHEQLNFREALEKWLPEFTLFLLHPDHSHPISYYRKHLSQSKAVGFIVGPEGGFHKEEISVARELGVHLLKMGPRIMRTETMAIASLAMVQTLWGDFDSYE